MRKIYLILILGVFASINAQTQFGVKAGYNLSNMKWIIPGMEDYKYDSKSYFYIGGLAEHHLSDQFSLQGELIYTEIGGGKKEIITGIVGNEVVEMGTANIKILTSQIQVPLSAKYYPTTNFSLSAGFNFGFNVNSRVKTDFVSDYLYNGKTTLFKTVNIFPFLGTEYKFNTHLFADARYHFGLFNVAKDYAPETKIAFFQIGLGYRFK